MLHRSFKPAKCKTSLKLATSRIKLLKNKKAEQVKQLKRELARLLESGQEQTARIRVEHVVREEKMMAAYDLIEIYCELIVARLPIIESQKNCPIDLKEAVSSVVFAAPRCADIPELMDVRKHFTAKYGKEFVSGAVELRPDCGVSRLVVEKLSAKPPDGLTKIKILKAIAEEHNINWDHELLEEKESKPPDDLLNGPNTFEMAGRVPINPPTVQTSPSPHDKGSSNVQVSYQNNERDDVFKTYDELKARQSPQFDYSQTSSQTQSSGTLDLDTRPSGTGVQRTEFRDSYSADGSTSSPGRQNWNMEFKDATAAAQAAAESAERASMAAREAAQLAGRGDISRQHSTESYKSSTYGMRDDMSPKDAGSTSQNLQGVEFSSRANMSQQHSTELHKSASYGARNEVPHSYAGSTGQRGHHTGGPVNSSRHESYSGIHHEQTEVNCHDNLEGEVGNSYNINNSADSPKKSGSFKSSPSSYNGETYVIELDKADRYSRRNSSGKSQAEHLGINRKLGSSENMEHHEVRIRKQSSNSSSRSHSSSFGNDRDDASNLFAQDTQDDLSEGPFVNDNLSNIKETHPYDNASMAFDDSGSDDDIYNIDLDHSHKEYEYGLGFSPPGHQSSSHLSPTANSWSASQNVESPRNHPTNFESHFFTEEEDSAPSPSESLSKSPVTSQTVDLPVTFDNSDGPSSESEGELEKPKLVGNVDSNNLTRKENVESHEDKKDISSQLLVEATEDSDDPVEVPSSESDKELRLGNLTGGLRNKGLRRPPYSGVHRGSASSSREAAPDTSPVIAEPPPAVEFPVSHGSRNQEPFKKESNATENKRPSTIVSIAHDTSSEEESDHELPKQTLRSSMEEKYDKRGSIRGNQKPISTVPVPFFDSGDSDSDEDIPKRTSVNDFQPKPVLSRRTKTSDSNTESTSNFRTSVFADPHGSALEDSSFSRRCQAPESTPKTRPQKRESELQESYDQFSEPSVISGSPMENSSLLRRSQAPEAIRKTMPQKRDLKLQESYDQSFEPSVTGGSPMENNFFSRRSQASESLPKTRPQKRDSELREGYDQHRRMEQAATAMENNSFSRRSQAPEAKPKTRPQKRDTEHQESYDQPTRMEQAATPSENTSFSRRSQAPESFPKTRPQKRDSEQQENHDQHRRMERAAATKPVPETGRSFLDDNLRSTEKKKPSNSTPEKSPSGSASESAKASSGEGSSKPSHVHPKLPDFDTLSAHFQSLRQNR